MTPDAERATSLDEGTRRQSLGGVTFASPQGSRVVEDEVIIDVRPQHDLKSQARILEDVPEGEAQLLVTFSNIYGWVPPLVAPKSLLSTLKPTSGNEPKATYRQILHRVSGHCSPGEVLALMGPSGSGKTTLLSVIGGRTPANLKVEGGVTFNGHSLTRPMKRRIGYVLQDDLLFETLTVKETLHYAATLRLPRTFSSEDKAKRVESVLDTLNLQRCRDTIIGGPFMRGVSGGERKRVSVGHELLINPSTIMLDEPTSGLDSTTAMNLVTTLKVLAAGGRSIITTIHQPSSRLYQQLDKLMLLSQGHVMYYGAAQAVHTWFESLGFPVPFGMNTADYILDLANGDLLLTEAQAKRHTTDEEVRTALINIAEVFASSHQEDGFVTGSAALKDLQLTTEAVDAAGGQGIDTVREPDLTSDGRMARIGSHVKALVRSKGGKTDGAKDSFNPGRWGISWPEQVSVLLQRTLQVRRFEALSSQKALQIIVVAIVAGLFWWQRGESNTLVGANDMAGLIFFEMLFMSFSSMFSALFTFPAEYRMLLKEKASGMYSLSSFYVSRTLSDLPLDCLFPSLFVIIIYWMSGLRQDFAAFIANWATVLLLVLTAQSYGLIMGAIAMNPKSAQTATTIIILTFMLVGGFYVRDIPAWIGWLKFSSFIYWGYSLLAVIQFGGRDYFDCEDAVKDAGDITDGSGVQGCELITDLQDRLGLDRGLGQSGWLEAGVLLAMLFGMRIAIYYVLRYKVRKV